MQVFRVNDVEPPLVVATVHAESLYNCLEKVATFPEFEKVAIWYVLVKAPFVTTWAQNPPVYHPIAKGVEQVVSVDAYWVTCIHCVGVAPASSRRRLVSYKRRRVC